MPKCWRFTALILVSLLTGTTAADELPPHAPVGASTVYDNTMVIPGERRLLRSGVYAAVSFEDDDHARITGFSDTPPTLAPGSSEAVYISNNGRSFQPVFARPHNPKQVPSDVRPPSSVALPERLYCSDQERNDSVLTPCSSHFGKYVRGGSWGIPKVYEIGAARFISLMRTAMDADTQARLGAIFQEQAAARSQQQQQAQEALATRCGGLMTMDGARTEMSRRAEQADQVCARQGITEIVLTPKVDTLIGKARYTASADHDGLPELAECPGMRELAQRETELVRQRGVPWSKSATPYTYYLVAYSACR
ncbi:MAG TPA: hypothetical protein VFA75_05380 [Nevskia sp.]|nr:hypothetical protein [Nevskia sp.]